MYDNKRVRIINFIVLIVLVCNVKCDFVSGNHRGEVRCLEKEREALLRFKKDLIDDFAILTSWGNETRKRECCKWRGVHCSNTTGHVIALQLPGNNINGVYFLGGEISSALLELHHLKDLDLGSNDFEKTIIPEFIYSMTQLQHLDLSECNFNGTVPPQLGNLTNLKTLYLVDNYFTGFIPPQLGNLTNLQELDLGYNYLSSENLSWLNSDLSLLSGLDLSRIIISDANWAQHILKLPSLEELHLRSCGLVDFKPSSVRLSINSSSSSTSSLSILNLSENNLTSFTIDWLFNKTSGTSLVATNLRKLYLWGNKLETLPASIWKLSKLEELDVSSNSLEGTITEANLTKFQNLKNLALSFNSLTIDINPDWVPPFHLDLISLAGCNMGPRFPLWLRTQRDFHWLDLSSNDISGEVPKWLWSLSPEIQYLNISCNEFNGTLSDYSPSIGVIDVSFNKFSGHIPLPHPETSVFQFSQNMLSGSILSLCKMPFPNLLFLLDLSNNQLEGKLPNCWQNMTELFVINMSNNRFTGEIPHGLGSLSNLNVLQLGNNNLTRELPSTLKNCKHLKLFDVQDNMLTGNIPTWIGAFHETMMYLIFRNNKFEGSIPPQICILNRIHVLDLSRNHLSGNIPPCFNNFTYLVQNYFTAKPTFFRFFFLEAIDHPQDYIYYATVSWKHQKSEYKRNLQLLKLIDLSSNRLVGDIPRSFSSLTGLISLNLSTNSLTGTINPDIGQMEMLDSLDLSSNQLSGPIPDNMSQLSFLGVLDLSNNNLSGQIPPSTKLQSFAASFYAGNAGLCGIPLPLCPGDGPHPSTNNKSGETENGILSFPFLTGLVISIILGFIFGFWGVVGSLIVKESWRRAYFNFWDAVGNWLYVTTAIFWDKLIRRSLT